jgi:uncharacterized membrane protein YoaK (UPF0700 family)
MTDVIGFLTLHHAFVVHMTGNTVSSVLYGVDRNWGDFFHRVLPIPWFFFGLLIGEILLELAHRHNSKRVAQRVLLAEAICFATFLGIGLSLYGTSPRIDQPTGALFILMVALIAIAMGVQSASLRRIGALTIFTTFMTGTLTKLANDLSTHVFWLHDRTHGRFRHRWLPALRLSWRQESFQAVLLLSGLYLCYAAGALVGSEGFYRWGVAIIAVPLALVVCAILVDFLRPIASMP